MKNEQDQFEVLRKIEKVKKSSQRELAEELGFSLGKLNYCLKSLQKKGLIKLKNFQKQPNKIKYLKYVITPKGIAERTKLTMNFMKRKMKEYDEVKERTRKIRLMQNLIQKTYLLSSKEWQKKTLDIINKITQNKNNILISGGETVKPIYRNIDIKKIEKKNYFRR